MNRAYRGRAMAACGLALACLLVSASISSFPSADKARANEPTDRSLPSADRKAMERLLRKAFDALPTPGKEFRVDKNGGSREIEFSTTTWAVHTKAPAEAREARVYTKSGGADDDADPIVVEVRVYLNMEREFPEPLGSEGGVLETFTHDGYPGSRASLAGVDPSRVALPLTPEEGANALTVLRLHIGASAIESYLTEIAQGRKPPRTPWDQTPARSPSEIRTLVVEYYGPRAEVERLLKTTTAAPLKELLTK